MRSVPLAALALTLTAGSAAAQVPLATDVEHPFASRLPGAWRHDAALAETLGDPRSGVRGLEWQPDPARARDLPTDSLPPGHTAYACGLVRVALDGRIVAGTGLLTSAHGAAHLVVLGPDLEPWIRTASLSTHPDPSRDVLLLDGAPLRRTAGATSLAWDDAERALATAVATPHEPDVRLRRGELLLRARLPLRALAEFERVLSLDDDAYLGYVGRGRAYLAVAAAGLSLPADPFLDEAPDPLDEARDDLEEAIALDGTRPEAYHQLAALYRQLGDLPRATQHDEIALSRRSDFHPARLGLARTAIRRGDLPDALEQLDPLLSGTPRALAYTLAARAHALSADVITNLTHARHTLGPDATPDAVHARAHADRQDHLASAHVLLERALSVDSSNPDTWLELARVASALDRTDAAARAAQVAVDLLRDRPFTSDPDPALRYARALSAFFDDPPPPADDDQPLTRSALALFLLRTDADSAAPELLAQARALRAFTPPALGPDPTATQRLRALCHLGQLAWDDPLHASAREAQAELALSLRAPEAAHAAAELAVAADPLRASALLLLGHTAQRDDPAAARAAFERALQLSDDPRLVAEARAGCGRALLESADDPTDPRWFEGRADLARARRALPDDLSRLDTPDLERHLRLLEDLARLDAAAAERSKDDLQRARDAVQGAVHRLLELARRRGDQLDYVGALELLDQLLALDDGHAEAHYLRGTYCLKIGNFIPGMLHFARSLELDPAVFDQVYNKVYQISYVVDLNRVLTELNGVVSDHPDTPSVYFLRALFYLCKAEFAQVDLADLRQGIADCDTALDGNSFFVAALIVRAHLSSALALLTQDPGERADARARADADFAELHQLHPTSATAPFLHAQHLLRLAVDAEADEREDLHDRALELLLRAFENGFRGYERLDDDCFDPLRDRPEFRALTPR